MGLGAHRHHPRLCRGGDRSAGGKLIAAGRAWAFARTGRADPARLAAIDARTAADCAALGIVIPAERSQDDGTVEVWDVNWPALAVFLDLTDQWEVVGAWTGAIHLGLPVERIETMIRRHRIAEADADRVFFDTLELAAVALPILNDVA